MNSVEFISSATKDTSDPGEILHQKTMELLKNPRRYDNSGRELNEKLTYSQALDIVMQENPELAQQYFKSLPGQKRENATETAAAKMMNDLISKKMKADSGLSFSEAFTAVQKEHPALAREYKEEL